MKNSHHSADMSKSKKQAAKLKAHRLQTAQQPKSKAVAVEPLVKNGGSGEDQEDLIPPEDLEITIETLSAIVEDPEVLGSQKYKQLKRVGWDFGKVLSEQGAGAGGCSALSC